MSRLTVTIAFLVAGLAAAPAAAQSGDDVTAIIRSLAPIAGQSQPATPGVDLTAQAPTEATPRDMLVEVLVEERVIYIDPAYSMDFQVYFAFDSSALTPQARADLRALGRALESPDLRPYRYVIAGHTDAVGNPTYNKQLSERRALSARRYLVENFAIDPNRLVSVGFGEGRLKTPENPRAGINRRVEVAKIATR